MYILCKDSSRNSYSSYFFENRRIINLVSSLGLWNPNLKTKMPLNTSMNIPRTLFRHAMNISKLRSRKLDSNTFMYPILRESLHFMTNSCVYLVTSTIILRLMYFNYLMNTWIVMKLLKSPGHPYHLSEFQVCS